MDFDPSSTAGPRGGRWSRKFLPDKKSFSYRPFRPIKSQRFHSAIECQFSDCLVFDETCDWTAWFYIQECVEFCVYLFLLIIFQVWLHLHVNTQKEKRYDGYHKLLPMIHLIVAIFLSLYVLKDLTGIISMQKKKGVAVEIRSSACFWCISTCTQRVFRGEVM